MAKFNKKIILWIEITAAIVTIIGTAIGTYFLIQDNKNKKDENSTDECADNPCSIGDICVVKNNENVCKKTLCSEDETELGSWKKPDWNLEECRQQTTLYILSKSIETVPHRRPEGHLCHPWYPCFFDDNDKKQRVPSLGHFRSKNLRKS